MPFRDFLPISIIPNLRPRNPQKGKTVDNESVIAPASSVRATTFLGRTRPVEVGMPCGCNKKVILALHKCSLTSVP